MLKKFKILMFLGLVGSIAGSLLVGGVLLYFSYHVPSIKSLADYTPHEVTKVYSRNGQLLAEYAKERRIYVPIEDIPTPVIHAFLAAEDSDFYKHSGFDLKGIIRAALVNVFTSRKQGASTITQQVAKTFLLSNERTYTRKIKELILSSRIEKSFTKNEILSLYLNQIYLGSGAYGVAAAAETYFGKPLEELDIGQRAMLAGLPKAPSAYNPLRHPRVARWRRDVVIGRMEAEGYITTAEAAAARAKGLELKPKFMASGSEAPYFAEHVRREVADKFGSDALYTGGMSVSTTLDPQLQKYAQAALRGGLRDYDRRHGFRGAIGHVTLRRNWQARIDDEFRNYKVYRDFAVPAVVLKVDDAAGMVQIGLPGGGTGAIPLAAMTWARTYIDADHLGPKIVHPSDVAHEDDIVLVAPLSKFAADYPQYKDKTGLYSLEQLPKVQGALVAIDIHTGAVRAMVGGFEESSEFNRAVQARRQPGSAFKPLVYALAMERGYTPASLVLDAPIVQRNSVTDEVWKPQNYSKSVGGPTTLRHGLEHSRNLMTIRLARDLGIRNIIDFAGRFGLPKDDMVPNLSTALGSAGVSLLDLTSAYSAFPNQGKRVPPYFIDRVQDASGKVVYQPQETCTGCAGFSSYPLTPPKVQVASQQVISPDVAYVMVDMLRGVVTNGTGWRARAVGHPVGAKTGTTNDYVDAWFVGFTQLYAVGVWVGFDQPQTLGKNETGSRAASPIWTAFLKNALQNYRRRAFEIPEGVTFVRIDADTGTLPTPATKHTTLEVFVKGTEPGSKPKADSASFTPGQPPRSGQPRGAMPPPVTEDGLELQGIY